MTDNSLTFAIDQYLQGLRYEGSNHLREQRKEGLMDDEQALVLIRDDLFGRIKAPRLRKLEDREFCACPTVATPIRGPRMPSRADYGVTTEVKTITPDQYLMLRAIRTTAPAGAQVVLREHWGHCRACGRDKRRVGVLVSLEWHGRPLSREYGLEVA